MLLHLGGRGNREFQNKKVFCAVFSIIYTIFSDFSKNQRDRFMASNSLNSLPLYGQYCQLNEEFIL